MSRALPGGMLNSKEKTEYEDWLEKIHKSIDKNKAERDCCPMTLFDAEGGANGCHNYDGSLMKESDKKTKIYESIYYNNMGLDVLYEAYKLLHNFNSNKLKEANGIGTFNTDINQLSTTVDSLDSKLDAVKNFYRSNDASERVELKTKSIQNWVDDFEGILIKVLGEIREFNHRLINMPDSPSKTQSTGIVEKIKRMVNDYLETVFNLFIHKNGNMAMLGSLKNIDATDFNLNDFENFDSAFKFYKSHYKK